MKKNFNLTFPPQLLIILGAGLWAFDGVLRRSLYVVSPLVLVTAEHGLGSLLILPAGLKSLLKQKISPRTWVVASVIALLSGLIGTAAFTAALQASHYIPFSVVFLLQKLNTLFAVTTAWIILKEKLPRYFLIWSAIAVIAGFFVTFPGGRINFSTGTGTIQAALLAITAAGAWGSSTALSKLLLKSLPVLSATTLRFLLTTGFGLIVIGLMGQLPSLALSVDQWLRLLMIAFSTGLVALVIYYKGLAKVKASQSAILELTFPLLAVLIDAFLYKVVLAPSQYLAAVVLLVAMWRVGKN